MAEFPKLLENFAAAVVANDGAALGALFTPEGTYVDEFFGAHRGRDAIAAMLQRFHDTGGDYSFAVALLDAQGGGVLITGLYHRDRCRVYAKPVQGWESSYKLSDEEREAIDKARGPG